MHKWLCIYLYFVPAFIAFTQPPKTYKLNLVFIFIENQTTKSNYKVWIEPRVEIVEKLFSSPLPFEVSYKMQNLTGPQNLIFRTNRGFHKFMDRKYDAIALDGEYWYPVVVVNDLYFKRERKHSEGKAYLPQKRGRRHGLMLTYQSDASTLAHELGHIFGLKHPWQPYVTGKKCNREFRRENIGPGETNDPGKRVVNLMDVRRKEGHSVYLTACQKERMYKYINTIVTSDGKLPARVLTK